VLYSAELYDPVTGAWTGTGSMNVARVEQTATLLPSNGKALVAGGYMLDISGEFIPLSSAELYDPLTGMWTTTGPMGSAREDHTLTWLPAIGKALAAGGHSDPEGFFVLSSAELYDP